MQSFCSNPLSNQFIQCLKNVLFKIDVYEQLFISYTSFPGRFVLFITSPNNVFISINDININSISLNYYSNGKYILDMKCDNKDLNGLVDDLEKFLFFTKISRPLLEYQQSPYIQDVSQKYLGTDLLHKYVYKSTEITLFYGERKKKDIWCELIVGGCDYCFLPFDLFSSFPFINYLLYIWGNSLYSELMNLFITGIVISVPTIQDMFKCDSEIDLYEMINNNTSTNNDPSVIDLEVTPVFEERSIVTVKSSTSDVICYSHKPSTNSTSYENIEKSTTETTFRNSSVNKSNSGYRNCHKFNEEFEKILHYVLQEFMIEQLNKKLIAGNGVEDMYLIQNLSTSINQILQSELLPHTKELLESITFTKDLLEKQIYQNTTSSMMIKKIKPENYRYNAYEIES
ncbi:hypothetical protein QTN25_000646 [Entamoeba marina]